MPNERSDAPMTSQAFGALIEGGYWLARPPIHQTKPAVSAGGIIISGRASHDVLGTLFTLAGSTTSDGVNGLIIGPNYASATCFRKFTAGESDMVMGPASLLDDTLDLAEAATNAAGSARAS